MVKDWLILCEKQPKFVAAEKMEMSVKTLYDYKKIIEDEDL